MFKKLSFRTKMILIMVMLTVLAFVAAFSIILYNIYSSSMMQSEITTSEISKSNAVDITSRFKSVETVTEVLRNDILEMQKKGITDRKMVIEMQKDVLKQYPDIYGVTVAFENNKFDSKDSNYKNKTEYGSDGMFIPYVTRDGNSFHVEAAYNSETDMTWYNIPKQTKKMFITEPTVYKVNGVDVSMASLVMPILDGNSNFQGVISIDYKLDTLQGIISKIKPMDGYAALISKAGVFIANGNNQKLIMTNAKKQGTEWNRIISETSKGKTVRSYIKVKGRQNLVTSYPVTLQGTSTNWALVSIVPKSSILADFYSLLRVIIVVTVVALILLSTFIGLFITYSTNGLKYAEKHLKVIAEGNLSQEIQGKYLKVHDEIGKIVQSIAAMQESLRNIINGVNTETNRVTKTFDTVKFEMDKLRDRINNVSATTEELSASMEETAASAEEMNASSLEIKNAVEKTTEKAQQGLGTSKEIYDRASKLKVAAEEASNNARDMGQKLDSKLRSALEQVKSVEKIDSLTDEILEITAQTNLLALNASIEAARAGEAGKGFAVVAGEINNLAENSKNTAIEIQNISSQVLTSVGNLRESSEEMMRFIQNQVVNDYKSFVQSGEQYKKDAKMVEELVSDFSSTSEELLVSIQDILQTVEHVASASNEGAEGTTNIAGETLNVSDLSQEVTKNIDDSKTTLDRLKELVAIFKL